MQESFGQATDSLISVTVAPECITKFNELKLGKAHTYIIYKLSDDLKEIVVEETGSDKNWEVFQKKLMNARSPHKGKDGKGLRYAVYDFQYDLAGGEGTRCVLIRRIFGREAGTDTDAGTRLYLFHGVQMRGLWSS